MSVTRITYVIGSLSVGGAEKQLTELLKHIDRSQYHISLVLLESGTEDLARELTDDVMSLGIASQSTSAWKNRPLEAASIVLRLAQYFSAIRPDVVHAILAVSYVLATPAARLARVPATIGSRRSMADSYRNGRLEALVDRLAVKMCDFVVANSYSSRSELIELDRVPRERVLTIHNGVDTQRFRPGERDVRRQYGWNENHVVFGIVANFISYKRHIDFIGAAELIARANPNARFVMAGQDRGILEFLRAEIENRHLGSFFSIIPGVCEPERLYPALDVYICTSETEGLSNVLLEAGACGLPIIATRVGGNPEIVSEGENGFLVKPFSPQEVAARALLLASSPHLRAELGQRNRARISSKFSIAAMVSAHENLYRMLVDGAQRTEPSSATSAAISPRT